MTGRRRALLIGLLALSLGGLAAGLVLAQGDGMDAADTVPSSESLLGRVAAILGIEETDLEAAFQQAHEQRIDEAVAEGRLTEEQAAQMKERMAFRAEMAEILREAVDQGRISEEQAARFGQRGGGGMRRRGMSHGFSKRVGERLGEALGRGGRCPCGE